MTVREFVSLCGTSAIIHIMSGGSPMIVFDSQYWEYITDEVLDLDIYSFAITNQLMKKADVTINVTPTDAETEPGPEEDPDDEEYPDPDDEEPDSDSDP